MVCQAHTNADISLIDNGRRRFNNPRGTGDEGSWTRDWQRECVGEDAGGGEGMGNVDI